MRPEVWARKKAIFSGVTASAAMIRSPFVLTVLVVHDDDDLPATDRLYRFLNR